MFKRAKPGQYSANKGIKKRKIPKPIRNLVIWAGVLLVVVIIIGAIYTWINGQKTDNEVKTETPVAVQEDPFLKPKERDPNAPVGVSVVFVTTPVKLGANATLTVRTTPEAICEIVVAYGENGQVKSTDSGLKPKIADMYGSASWTWTVEKNAIPGSWPMKVTCKLDEKSGVVEAAIKVIP